MEKQELRNALTRIEDAARTLRGRQTEVPGLDRDLKTAFNLIAQLTQIIRQEIVR